VFQAIRRFDTSIFDHSKALERLEALIHKRKYEEAITQIREIAIFFRKLENQLDLAPEFNRTFISLKQNVRARLIHQISEFNFLKMICYYLLNDSENVLDQAKKSVKDLRYAIQLTKEEIQSGYYSSADLERLVFDIFLLQIIQEFGEYLVEDPLDLALRDLHPEIQEQIKEMKFFEYTKHILKFDLHDSQELFDGDEMELPLILRPYRELIKKTI
jgi:hypothetical protein